MRSVIGLLLSSCLLSIMDYCRQDADYLDLYTFKWTRSNQVHCRIASLSCISTSDLTWKGMGRRAYPADSRDPHEMKFQPNHDIKLHSTQSRLSEFVFEMQSSSPQKPIAKSSD
jgi:hypothetical protein